jgi:hypothetical protein
MASLDGRARLLASLTGWASGHGGMVQGRPRRAGVARGHGGAAGLAGRVRSHSRTGRGRRVTGEEERGARHGHGIWAALV